MDGGGTMEVAALGRPFRVGMLYDCRKDSLIPGVTLWDSDDLMKHLGKRPQTSNDFEIVASESIEGKSSALNVEASLKASFLCGLVQVDGSAKYLNDSKTSRNQARVTLKYKATTHFQELSMDHLGRGNMKHQYVFEKGLATHVVTGILYGAQAFFVFDREVSEKEDRQDIEGNLKVVIKKIPKLSIEGEGSMKMKDEDTAKADKLSCRFYGDFLLEKTPTTFQDAVQVYQRLPKLLGADGEKAVPVKVWLLPLTMLDSSAAKLVREISVGLVQEAQRVLEDFTELDMRCNDALRIPTAQQFPQITTKLQLFQERCSEFKLVFQQTLAKKLPSIRGGGEEEIELAEVLKKRHYSTFNNKNLNDWMKFKVKEIYTLMSMTNMMKNTKILPSEDFLYKESLSAETAVCFVFTSLGCPEPFLSALSDYLRGSTKPEDPQHPHSHDVEKEQWFLSKEAAENMGNKTKLFRDFAEANKENQNIKFLTVGLTDETHQGSTIYLYKDGFSVSDNFEPPSKPETVAAGDINHDSVTLKISPPRWGAENVTSYSVEFCVSGEDGWQQKTAPTPGEVTVSGLRPNTEYQFRCRAVTSAGVGPPAVLCDPIKTLPCSPPGKPHVDPTSCEVSVIWEKPSELGQDVHIWSYIVEYAETHPEKKEDLHWKQMTSAGENAIISGLQSETKYAVRVWCDCGVAGRSKESITVHVCTKRREFARLPDYLKHISKMKNSDGPSIYMLPLEEEDMDIDGCRRLKFGQENMRQNKTIMLLGATGSGKSTLINGMINYIVGVNWKDSFRFKLIDEDQSTSQAYSQTSEVTVYQINHQDGFTVPFSLSIIDTPGFGDTRGVARDKEITEQIRRLFTSLNGVSEIDAVCFVSQAALARLTATQRYVFDSVLSIFGKDVAENIRMLVTFADGKQPPVLEAINAAGVPCPKNELGLPVHFKFNNSALFADNRSGTCDEDNDSSSFDEMFWKMGVKNIQRFFTALGKMTPKSLLMTQEVLKERKQLETAIEGLQPQVKVGLAQLEEIRTTKEKIKEHEAVMASNENFEIEVDVIRPVQKKLTEKGVYITNCQVCSVTCHYPCGISKDTEKRGCASMDNTGKCSVCPGKCNWTVHFNQPYRWEYIQVKEKQTLQDIKSKYMKATKEKMTIQELIERQEEAIVHLQDMVVSLMDQSARSITRLQEISLRPNPLTTPEYIEMLIEGEISEAKEGYLGRVQALETLREKAKLIRTVVHQDKFTKTDEEILEERQKKKEKIGFFQKLWNWTGNASWK